MESIGQLTAGLAHDFNNLLQVVNGNLELLAARMQDDRGKRYVENARSAAERGAKLTRQLLALPPREPGLFAGACIPAGSGTETEASTMESDRHKAIEARAYQIWEESGQAHGMHDEHWRQAEQEVDGAAQGASGDPQNSGPEERPTDDVTSSPRRDARQDTPKRSKR